MKKNCLKFLKITSISLALLGVFLMVKREIPIWLNSITKNLVTTPYNVKASSRKIKIAVVDTGVMVSHPDISPFLIHLKSQNQIDQQHGTGVVGIISSTLTQVYGSQAPELFAIEVFSYQHDAVPFISSKQYLKALQDAVFSDPDIINISSVGYEFLDEEAVLLKVAALRGIKIVAAAGNDDGNISRTYPCGLTYVVCVGSNNSSSNIGSHVDLFAAGSRMAPANDYIGYERVSGTSFSAPFISAYFASLMVNSKSYDYFKKDIKVNPSRAKEQDILIQGTKIVFK